MEKGTIARVRRGRGRRKAGMGGVEVASIQGVGQIKAKELDSPLARDAGEISVPIPTAGGSCSRNPHWWQGRGGQEERRGWPVALEMRV
jgi:hypothetical protein